METSCFPFLYESEKMLCFEHLSLFCRLFSFLNEYYDVLFCGRTPENATEMKSLLCLHALNHIFKTRDKVLKNNAKLRNNSTLPSDFEPKDQGIFLLTDTHTHTFHKNFELSSYF
jgi:hypothetical protein